MAQIPPEEERFLVNSSELAEVLYQGVKVLHDAGYKVVDPNMILLAKAVIMNLDKKSLITGFIDNSHQLCWNKIRVRDEIFFIENASGMFKDLPTAEINLFKDLFTIKDANGQAVVGADLKNSIWDTVDSLIKICIKYIHKRRDPYSMIENGVTISCYGNDEFADIRLSHHAENWGVLLDFPLAVL